VKISIIVPAYNEEKLISAALASINAARSAFTAPGWDSELIVCNNNSTDRTGELAAAAGATVVFEPVNQIARARNAGAAAASGDWFVFVDADSHPDAALFAAVAAEIQRGRCLGGGCAIKLDEFHLLAEFFVGGWNLLSRLKRWAAGSFVFCEANAFRQVGGFSRELFVAEEIDLSERLKKLGRETGREMVILHRQRLVTSARKFHLYSTWEHLRFLLKTIFQRGRPLKTREQCAVWYDGRR